MNFNIKGKQMSEQIVRTTKQLGAVLRRVRKKAGLTQSHLGRNIHLRQATVSRLEAGEPSMYLQTLMDALAALNLELVIRQRTTGGSVEIEELF